MKKSNFKTNIISLKKTMYKNGIKSVFRKLDELLDHDSEQFNTFIILASEHKKLDKDIISGTIDTPNENLQLSKIRGRLLKFIDGLVENDLTVEQTKYNLDKSNYWGIKEFSAKTLLAIGKMTPEIANERISLYVDIILTQRKNLTNARKLRDELLDSTMQKINYLKNSEIKDKHLIKKYINDFKNSFKPFNQETINFAKTYDMLSEDWSILFLYNIERYFSSRKINEQEINELLIEVDRLIERGKSMANQLDKRIEEEKELHQIKIFENFNIKKTLEESIESKIKLKESTLKFNKEVMELKNGANLLLNYKN